MSSSKFTPGTPAFLIASNSFGVKCRFIQANFFSEVSTLYKFLYSRSCKVEHSCAAILSGFFTLVASIYSDVVGTFVAITTPFLSKISGCLCTILSFLKFSEVVS